MRTGLLSPEMASALLQKIRFAAIELTPAAIEPIFMQSELIVQDALALAEFHRKHSGAGYALEMLRPLLDAAERIRTDATLQAFSMELANPIPPDLDI